MDISQLIREPTSSVRDTRIMRKDDSRAPTSVGRVWAETIVRLCAEAADCLYSDTLLLAPGTRRERGYVKSCVNVIRRRPSLP